HAAQEKVATLRAHISRCSSQLIRQLLLPRNAVLIHPLRNLVIRGIGARLIGARIRIGGKESRYAARVDRKSQRWPTRENWIGSKSRSDAITLYRLNLVLCLTWAVVNTEPAA